MKDITKNDILSLPDYEKIRAEKREEIIALKNEKRFEIGPYVSCYFENFDTIWYQIHEMLRIEKGGQAQVDDELEAYKDLVPGANKLTATIMFEINDKTQREKILNQLGGIEEKIYLKIDDKKIFASSVDDHPRSTEEGRLSAVLFVKFEDDLLKNHINQSSFPAIEIGFEDERYSHKLQLSPAQAKALFNI